MSSIASWIILLVMVLVSLAGFNAFKERRNEENFLFIPYLLRQGQGQVGTLVSQFSHGSFGHLLFNALSFFFFGPGLEAALGTGPFLFIYAASALGSTVLTYVLRKDDPGYRALGASGAVSGVIFAAIVADPSIDVFIMFIPIPIPGPVFGIIYLIASGFMMRGEGVIAHEAHIGGAVAGFVAAALLVPHGLTPLLERLLGIVGMN